MENCAGKYGKEQMLITYSDNARLRRVCETLYEHELFMYETHWFLSSMKSNLNMTRFEHLSQDEEEEVRRYVPVQTREELLELAGNKRLMEMVARYCVNRLADVERNIGGVFFKCVMERWVMLSFKWKSDT